MYDINQNTSRTDLYEVGKGNDQLFNPETAMQGIEFNAKAKERKAAENQAVKDKRQQALEAEIAKMQGKAIMPFDMGDIYNQQKDLSDYTVQNIDAIRNNDPKAMMAVNQKLAQLQQNVAISEKLRNDSESFAKEVLAHPDDFTPGTQERLNDFILNGKGTKFFNGNNIGKPSIASHVDLDNLRKGVDQITEDSTTEIPIGNGATKTVQVKVTDPEKKRALIEQNYDSSNRVKNLAESEFESAPDEIKSKFKTPKDYYIHTREGLIGINKTENKTSAGWKSEKGSGNSEEDTFSTEPATFNITTPGTDNEGNDKSFDATATSIATGRLAKPLLKDLTLFTDVRDINGNKVIPQKGVSKVEGSDLVVVPIYNEGSMSNNKLHRNMGGNIVPQEKIDNAVSEGAVTYKPMLTANIQVPDIYEKDEPILDSEGKQSIDENGKPLIHKKGEQKVFTNEQGKVTPLTKTVSIVTPAKNLTGGVGKSQKLLDQLQEAADNKNEEIKKLKTTSSKEQNTLIEQETKIKTGTSKSGKEIYSEDGGKTWKYK